MSWILHLNFFLYTMLLLTYIISERNDKEWGKRRRGHGNKKKAGKKEKRKEMPGERKRNIKAANKSKLLNKALSLH